jgi:hypothetical protein
MTGVLNLKTHRHLHSERGRGPLGGPADRGIPA